MSLSGRDRTDGGALVGSGRTHSSRAQRMVVSQGDVAWASLPDPAGSGPGFRPPVVVVQGDALNASHLATVVVVPLTSNLRWGVAPGNVSLTRRQTGLPKDSVANVSQIVSVDRGVLSDRVGRVSKAQLALILNGVDVVLGR
ncbi:MAG: type II toxin-antitoxin system PemK/MazF family toxin [Actinomycetota bacterium]